MNIHKFNAKPRTTLPKTIQWRPLRDVKYPARKVNPMTWENFSQQEIKLDQKEVKQIRLGFGFMMSKGVVLVALANSLKYKWCSLQNEVNLENVEDIIITLTNNSSEILNIQEHELLCHVCYLFQKKKKKKNSF